MIDDDRPPSVQLGEVVPPEDPEDWGQPLTWIVAAGMLVTPLAGAAWFILAAPTDPRLSVEGISALAVILALGAAITGATQRGMWRTFVTSIGAGLFNALGLVVVGTVLAGGASLGVATVAAVAGVIATVPTAMLAALLADSAGRGRRIASPALAGGVTALVIVRLMTSL
jgi:hypothetical protein